MKKIQVLDRLSRVILAQEKALEFPWIEKCIAAKTWGNPEMEYPKKGLGYDNEFNYNDLLVMEGSEFEKEITPMWTETLYEKDENGDYLYDGDEQLIPTGLTTSHPAIIQTWIRLHPEYEIVGPTDITAEYEAEQDEASKVALGIIARNKCQKVLDYIAGYNLSNSFSIEQITQMQTTFANVETALRASRPDLALGAVNLAVPDGVVVTQELKDKVIELLG